MKHVEHLQKIRSTVETQKQCLDSMKHKFVYKSEKRRNQYDEVCKWCQSNIQGDWMPMKFPNMVMYMFKDAKDATLFKLTWG